MKSAFQPQLVNGPFGDPGLYVGIRWRGEAVLFDLGSLDRFPSAHLLRVRHIFVSHTHLDHFVGFDRLLRIFLARPVQLTIYGPPGILHNVRGKLQGYTWNLVDGYEFGIVVHEVHRQVVEVTRLRAATGFQPEAVRQEPFDGILYDDASFRVECVELDHRIPCLGFSMTEPTHLNVRPEILAERRLIPGPWLNQVKRRLREGGDPEERLRAWRRGEGDERTEVEVRLGEIAEELIVTTAGQKLAYVVDVRFSRGNAERIVELARGADLFFCESLFLDIDRHEAEKRCHLTARQAGTLARLAGVRQLRTFHFSPRYAGEAPRLREEAEKTFRGEIPADVPDEIPPPPPPGSGSGANRATAL